MVLSAVAMLDWLGHRHGDARLLDAGKRIFAATEMALASGCLTADLKGSASTREVTEVLCRALRLSETCDA